MPADCSNSHSDHEWAATDHPRFYGTREQTVILVSREDGRVIHAERTLWNEEAEPIPEEKREIREEFVIEGWNEKT